MRRGDLVTVALQGDYGKPRPALVVQSSLFADHPSVTILPLTSELRETPIFRIRVLPSATNGLRAPSDVMVDKLHTVSRDKIRETIGLIGDEHLIEIERAVAVWLGIAD
ncbi:MAG: type II toxin-antitoxin system PemK/MazF family toxin [Rhodocyclaceae bacterium]|nr:type II toxin-antitoxin system PemK/MazF family toxin [Rhodocyclaceae bacterium]MDZ4213685.1 type II toxin-antitoxin system PemK/MazF family toxin [Rhodocyclaceae bacterium]